MIGYWFLWLPQLFSQPLDFRASKSTLLWMRSLLEKKQHSRNALLINNVVEKAFTIINHVNVVCSVLNVEYSYWRNERHCNGQIDITIKHRSLQNIGIFKCWWKTISTQKLLFAPPGEQPIRSSPSLSYVVVNRRYPRRYEKTGIKINWQIIPIQGPYGL